MLGKFYDCQGNPLENVTVSPEIDGIAGVTDPHGDGP